MKQLEQFLEKANELLDRLDAVLPQTQTIQTNWQSPTAAFRWKKKNGVGELKPIMHISPIDLSDLFFVEKQKAILEQNTRQFLAGKPANNILMTGARGTGKSSLVKACLNAYADQGLRLIEVNKEDLIDLDDISDLVSTRPERFILYCDDLSFDENDSSYKALKVALDGSISAQPENILIYATSNRRHLLHEKMSDNDDSKLNENGDLHPGETVEEKISLSDRFGLWMSFYPYDQEQYLKIVNHWLTALGCTPKQIEDARAEALRWALHRGSRSGRIAHQFAKDYAGKLN